MGKAVPKGLKSKAEFLLSQFDDKFSVDFEKNKEVFNELKIPLTKVNRNILLGYITRQRKRKAASS
ncbi:MAG: 30S ribosomal protein S17e [Candidatus Diapherotrites archaeon]|uniref:30S ribosomal protein S17e n=1 Tax=Candidatus Iainarchaeum sp. TaxID=3101447 RepID=A0A8T4LEA0_9ARCH|nr:30S ribosomal protein S17e [Candidatus Diapherotrites archaeon]